MKNSKYATILTLHKHVPNERFELKKEPDIK